MLSNGVRRWLRDSAEKLSDSFYEDEKPPARISAAVAEFAKTPHNVEEWKRFCSEFAEKTYSMGYVRGVEYVERSDWWRSDIPPEELADMQNRRWRERPVDVNMDVSPNTLEVVHDDVIDNAIRKAARRQ